jgi:hypothetical protein
LDFGDEGSEGGVRAGREAKESPAVFQRLKA